MREIAQRIHRSRFQVAQATACELFTSTRPNNPRKLKPAPLFVHIKKSQRDFIQRCGLALLITLSVPTLPVAAQQQATAKTLPSPSPMRDLSGLWHYEGTGASEPIAPE